MFGFPKAGHAPGFSFKKNFLNVVTFQLKFPRRKFAEDAFIDIRKLYPQHNAVQNNEIEIKFEATPVIASSKREDYGGQFRSADGHRLLTLTPDAFTLTILNNTYQNFETEYSEFYQQFQQFASKQAITNVSRIAVRKINAIGFRLQGQETRVDVLGMVFNPQIAQVFHILPENSYVNTTLFRNRLADGDFRLNLAYGIPNYAGRPSPNDQIILDIDVFTDGPLRELTQIGGIMTEINSVTYDIFRYFISDPLLKHLEGEEVK